MSGGAAHRHRGRDLDSPEEVAELVRRFYRDVAQDERFHYYFNVLAGVDWHAHNLELTDFWWSILTRGSEEDLPPSAAGRGRADEMIERHRWLHGDTPFDDELFDRWLGTFEATLDGGWTGPGVEIARARARGMVWAMSKRFLGHGIARAE